jgi:hypothetical protein
VGLLGVWQGYLWWVDGWHDSIGRARLDGTDRQPDFITGVRVGGGALSPPWLYFTGSWKCTDDGCGWDSDGTVSRIELKPGATPEFLTKRPAGTGYSIAVDSLGDPAPTVQIAKHSNGTATAVVSTPRPAKVSVRGKRIHARASHSRSKVARVAIRPRRSTKRALRRHGAAHVGVRIAYRPFQGVPRSQRRTLRLHLAGRG